MAARGAQPGNKNRLGQAPWNKGVKLDRKKYPNAGHKKKHSDEAKEKMRSAKLGKKRKPFTKNTIEKMRIKEWTLQHKNKISISKQGERNASWKGGITPINRKIRTSREYRIWRKAVMERDKNCCIWCAAKEQLEVDHIKPFAYFPELRFAIDNGRTLCRACHQTTHTFAKKFKEEELCLL